MYLFIYFFTKPLSRVFSPKGLNRLVAIALLYLTAEESFWFVAHSFFIADFCRSNGCSLCLCVTPQLLL